MNRRKEDLFNIFFECCKSSSIKLHDFVNDKYLSSIKFFYQTGEIFFIGNDRHFDIVVKELPGWNETEDMKLLDELNDNVYFRICEGGKYNGKYTYSIMLLKEDL